MSEEQDVQFEYEGITNADMRQVAGTSYGKHAYAAMKKISALHGVGEGGWFTLKVWKAGNKSTPLVTLLPRAGAAADSPSVPVQQPTVPSGNNISHLDFRASPVHTTRLFKIKEA